MLTDSVYEDILEGLVIVLASNDDFEKTKADLVRIYYPWILRMTETRKLVEEKKLSKDHIHVLIDSLNVIKIITRAMYNHIKEANKEIIYLIFSEVWDTIKYLLGHVKVRLIIYLFNLI